MVEILEADEAAALVHHLRLHLQDNGSNGVVFAPAEAREITETAVQIHARAKQWAEGLRRSVYDPQWRRVWVLRNPQVPEHMRDGRSDGAIVGHVDLRGGGFASELHRCRLAVGIYTQFRGMGLGKLLVQEAVAWARAQPGLDWIDLGVFSHNTAAIHVYQGAGFAEIGRVEDRFRIQGGSVDEVLMAIKVAREPVTQ